MYKFVVLACAVAAVAAEADPSLAYANGLNYAANYNLGGLYAGPAVAGYAGLPATYAAGVHPYAAVGVHGYAAGYAAPAYTAAAVHAVPAPAVAAVHAAPSAYALPAVRTIAEAPIVETVVEPVEQWGYKVAY